MVPWQMVAQRTGAVLRFVRLTEDTQEFDLAHYRSLLSDRTRLVAVAHASNVLGVVNPVAEVIAAAKALPQEVAVLLDACQSVPHMPVDVQVAMCTGVLVYWCTGVLVYWCTGVLVYWCSDVVTRFRSPVYY